MDSMDRQIQADLLDQVETSGIQAGAREILVRSTDPNPSPAAPWGPRFWVPPAGHGLWVLLTGKFQLEAELLLALGDAAGRRDQREAAAPFLCWPRWDPGCLAPWL